MTTVVLASCTPEEEAMLAERHRLDQDRLDDVWFVLRGGRYEAVDRPPLLALDVQEVIEAVDWL